MEGFWGEMETALRCIKLVNQLLREEENIKMKMEERGQNTNMTEYNIARMEYALGMRSTCPNIRDYRNMPIYERGE